MNTFTRHPRLFSIAIGVVSLMLAAIPLPHLLDLIRPDFLLLVVMWFALMTPRIGGLTYAWIAGLALDAFRGLVLGENAFAFVVIAYLVHYFYLRIRMFPVTQQALVVMCLLWFYQFLLFWIDGMTGHAITGWARWLPAVTGAALWLPLSGVLARYTQRS